MAHDDNQHPGMQPPSLVDKTGDACDANRQRIYPDIFTLLLILINKQHRRVGIVLGYGVEKVCAVPPPHPATMRANDHALRIWAIKNLDFIRTGLIAFG